MESLFTKDDYRKLRDAMKECNRLPQEFDRAEACGVDCSALRTVCDEIRASLEAIEKHYMVPPPK